MSLSLQQALYEATLPTYRRDAIAVVKDLCRGKTSAASYADVMHIREALYACFKTPAEAQEFLKKGRLPQTLRQAFAPVLSSERNDPSLLQWIITELHERQTYHLPSSPQTPLLPDHPLYGLDQVKADEIEIAQPDLMRFHNDHGQVAFFSYINKITMPLRSCTLGKNTRSIIVLTSSLQYACWDPEASAIARNWARQQFVPLAGSETLIFLQDPPEQGQETLTLTDRMHGEDNQSHLGNIDCAMKFRPSILDPLVLQASEMEVAEDCQANKVNIIDIYDGPDTLSLHSMWLFKSFESELEQNIDSPFIPVINAHHIDHTLRRLRAATTPLPRPTAGPTLN